MNPRNFFAELKRRNVYKVAVAYAVVGWLIMQVAATVVPALHLPDGITTAVVVVTLLGFPIALVIAWAFEMTPEGMKRTENVSPDEVIPQWSARKFAAMIVSIALLATALLVFQTVRSKSTSPAQPPPESTAAADNKSIAVLPFENLSDEKENAYFAEGIQDEILTRLAKVGALKVISRTSTQHFKSSPENLPEIAQQLGVANILEGSVQREPDEVRVNVQLIKAATDAHLWAEIYDRKMTDLFAVESDIAKTIADTLQAKLTGSEKTAIAARPTENPEAYQLYLQGRFFWNKRTAPDLRKSIELFNQAIAKDPHYALAYAAIAQAWLLLPAYNGGAPDDCFPASEEAAKKALALDETCADAHVALASIESTYRFNYPKSIAEFERAIELKPNDATAHQWLANDTLANVGESDREVAEMKHALALDPLSLVINTNLGVAYLHHGQIDQAIAQLRRTVEMDGSFYYGLWNLAEALEVKGDLAGATAQFEKAVSISDDPVPLGLLAHLYGISGRTEEARKIVEKLQKMRAAGYINAYAIAVADLGLGDRTGAVHWLEQGYQDHDGFDLGAIRVDPILFSLHGDAAFEALAEKIVPAREFAKATSTSK